MKCPECDRDIEKVHVYSRCVQVGYLKENIVVDYDAVDEVMDTESVECPECGQEITQSVKL